MSLLGLQLYSLRREFARDAEAALRSVPGLGFDHVELAGTYDWPAEKWTALLKELGLKVCSAHVGAQLLEKDFEATAAFYRAVGCPALIVPHLPASDFTADALPATAERLNAIGRKAKDAGFRFGYHNHAHELAVLPDGRVAFEVLAELVDPDLVALQVDTYWVEKGGQSSLAFIEKMQDHIAFIHAKELRKSDGSDVPAGQGDVPFAKIIPLAKSKDWPVVIEFEGEGAPEAVKAGAAYLKTLL